MGPVSPRFGNFPDSMLMDPKTIKTREQFKPPPTIQNTTLAQRKFMKFNPTSMFRQTTKLLARVGGTLLK